MGNIMAVQSVAKYGENTRITNLLKEIGVDYGLGY
jgi:hypothetical protein